MNAQSGRPSGPSLPKRDGRARPLGAPSRGTRKRLPHDIPLWLHPEDAVWFITICTLPRHKNQLCHREIADRLFETIQFRNTRGDWFMHLALLMPDHVHLLVSFPPEAVMKKVVSQWKEIVAKKLPIHWQRDFFDHRLRRDESYREKEDYIRLNPVRAGFARSDEDWSYVWTPWEKAGRDGPPGRLSPATPADIATPGAPSGRALPAQSDAEVTP